MPHDPAHVDVLIPVFNAEATVESAVASIQTQTFRDIRIIVIDDGSSDGSPGIVARLAEADPRVQLIRQPNGGIVDALNNGLALCTAPFVARHDADDLAAPERFAQQLEYLDAHPRCIAVDGYYWHINADGRRVGVHAGGYGPVQFNPASLPSQEPYLTHPFLMIRREPLVAIGGYRHAYHSEDTDLYWRLLEHGELRHVPLFIGDYRVHSGSVSSVSIVNGRISAIASQLAAVSYLRRQAGHPDIDFPRDHLARYKAAGSLRAMLAVASEPLDADERRWLQLAVCAKLLELGSYRPYVIDDDDVALIVETFDRAGDAVSVNDAGYIAQNRAVMAVKLMGQGRWRAARRLNPHAVSTARSAVTLARRKARELYRGHIKRLDTVA